MYLGVGYAICAHAPVVNVNLVFSVHVKWHIISSAETVVSCDDTFHEEWQHWAAQLELIWQYLTKTCVAGQHLNINEIFLLVLVLYIFFYCLFIPEFKFWLAVFYKWAECHNIIFSNPFNGCKQISESDMRNLLWSCSRYGHHLPITSSSVNWKIKVSWPYRS